MGDTRFTSFIFNDNDNDQRKKQWEDAYTSFKGNPSQISGFLQNRELSGSFIAGFEVYAVRIARFVQLIPQLQNPNKDRLELDLQVGKLLSGYVIKGIIIPLLEQRYQHLHTRDALLELLFSTVALADRSMFGHLAARLGKAPALLGRLISDERCDNELKANWIGCINSSKLTETMEDWVEVSVDLAKNCESDHHVLSEMERWGLLTTLKLHLRQACNPGLPASQRKHSIGSVQTGSRASGSNESPSIKDRRKSDTSAGRGGIPQNCIALLQQLRIPIIDSKGRTTRIQHLLVHIETKETIPILEVLLKSFPCRLCFRRGFGNTSEAMVSPVHIEFGTEVAGLDSDSFEGLLGGGLGVWKIALSTQALRDLKQSQREGNVPHIKAKLEALASGDWVRGAVAGEVSKNHGDHRFRVHVYQAFYGGNGRILWQVDVGFDEKHNADSQIVRVWRIGDVKEIQNSLDSVYRAQKGFSQTRVERCRMNSIDKDKKIKIPVVFDVIDQEERDKLESTDERLPEDMLISGNVLESILLGQSHSDFPFDVTGKEVEIIKNKNATFILGRSGTGKTSCLLYKLMSRYLARNIAQPDTPIRQILLTRSEPLARKLESEVQLLIDTQLLRVKAGFNYLEDGANISLEIRDGMEENTTEDFFSLRKENFPFVCTFGHFLRRLENTIRGNYRKAGAIEKSRRLVDYVVFKEAYWVQFPAGIKSGLEPDLVFAEIMGVIKGASSLLTGLKPLSREQYKTMSARLAPTFVNTADRDTVYGIYEKYENKKANNSDYDGIDRVKTIIRELNENISLRRRLESIFEEVYVDEVQDQRPLEIELLLNLVQNPRGIHFAGDSAQCISKDSTFRFANLKTLFFNHFSASRFTRIDPAAAKPELFSLSRNFRSHQGILSLASFVMDLLWKGFPDMVDKLPPEIGHYLGPKPVIFIGSDLVEFLQMASKRTGAVENPAAEPPQDGSPAKQVSNQQIIIIRDHQEQEELQSKLGVGSLVFTVLQSKGMEYDDVFLYNFFSSSPCLRAFQTLQELLVPCANPSYGETHMNMCSELKSLYVAITRPRNRLWILESDPGFIPELLTQRVPDPLVEIKPFQPGEILFMMNEVSPTNITTEREWIETGDQCMDRGLFEQALRCYNNAYDRQKITLATACIAEQKGKKCQARGDVTLHRYFKDASVGFLELNMKERAATCLEALGDWAAAAYLYRERGRHEKAASLFEKARMFEEAAGQYHLSGKTLNALQSLHRGKLYERLVEDVTNYRYEIGDGDRMSYARECNMLLRRPNSCIRPFLWGLTFNMFTTDLEKEEFLEEFEYKRELLNFYLEKGRLRDAFFYSTKTGDIDTALSLMIERAETNSDALEMRELENIFSHSQAGRVLTHISAASTTGVDLGCEKRFLGMSRPWEDVATVAGQYFKTGNKLDRGSITSEWTRDYMDTTVSINIPYFLKFKPDSDLSDLPLEYLSGLHEIVQEVISGDREIPEATLCALGLLNTPGKSKPYITLKWSPLLRGAGRAETFTFDELLKAVVTYLSGEISSACSLIQERALVSWNSLLQQEKCRSCVTQVGWDRLEKVEFRKCMHTSIPRAQFERSMKGLLSIITYSIKLPEEYFTSKD
ncbi:hypothetical protein DFP73DRAFT_76530 [Morchella snyderi]|nr:hypothetical protein DFP73DRAFT_76530 [Morchella snyderi]